MGGSLTLGANILILANVTTLHIMIPSHWIGFVLVGKAQKWSLPKTSFITFLGGCGHVLTTLLSSFVLAYAGTKLFPAEMHFYLPPIVLSIFGFYYLLAYCFPSTIFGRDACCDERSPLCDQNEDDSHDCSNGKDSDVESHQHNHNQGARGNHENHSNALGNDRAKIETSKDKHERVIIWSAILVPSLSPCIASAPVLVSNISEALDGKPGALVASAILGLVLFASTVCTMVFLVTITSLTSSMFNFSFMTNHEKLIVALSLLGLALFILCIGHHDD